MNVQPVTDLTTPVGEILDSVGTEGVLLEAGHQNRYAVLPLDDDLLDYLLERSPRLTEVCRGIREEMQAGNFRTHDQVRKLFRVE